MRVAFLLFVFIFTDMKKQNLYLSFIFMIVFIIINAYSVNKYFIYTKVLNDNENVNYSYLNKTVHSGGKGKYYTMQVDFDNQVYDVSLTSQQFSDVENGNYPKLFLTEDNELITNWDLTIVKRFFIISTIGFLISAVSFFVLISR